MIQQGADADDHQVFAGAKSGGGQRRHGVSAGGFNQQRCSGRQFVQLQVGRRSVQGRQKAPGGAGGAAGDAGDGHTQPAIGGGPQQGAANGAAAGYACGGVHNNRLSSVKSGLGGL